MADHEIRGVHPTPPSAAAPPHLKFNASPSPIYKIGDGKRAPRRDNLMSTRHSVAGEANPDNYSALFNKISALETSVSRALTSRGGHSKSFEASLMYTPIDPPDLGETQGAKQPKHFNNDRKDLMVSLRNTQFAGDGTDLVTTTNLLRSLSLKLNSNGYSSAAAYDLSKSCTRLSALAFWSDAEEGGTDFSVAWRSFNQIFHDQVDPLRARCDLETLKQKMPTCISATLQKVVALNKIAALAVPTDRRPSQIILGVRSDIEWIVRSYYPYSFDKIMTVDAEAKETYENHVMDYEESLIHGLNDLEPPSCTYDPIWSFLTTAVRELEMKQPIEAKRIESKSRSGQVSAITSTAPLPTENLFLSPPPSLPAALPQQGFLNSDTEAMVAEIVRQVSRRQPPPPNNTRPDTRQNHDSQNRLGPDTPHGFVNRDSRDTRDKTVPVGDNGSLSRDNLYCGNCTINRHAWSECYLYNKAKPGTIKCSGCSGYHVVACKRKSLERAES
jgi:hypothetical protein